MPLNKTTLSGSISVLGDIELTGSLLGTASWSINAVSASHALLADGLNATSLTLADLTITNTASIEYLNVVYQSSSVIYSSGSNIFGDAPSDVQTLHGQVNIVDNATVSGKLDVVGGITGSLLGNASTATSASHALNADNAINADVAISASHALNADNAISASHALLANLALNADNASTASYFLTSSVTSASFALTASHVLNTKDVGFQKEWHVSAGSGSDVTGNGSLSKPFATLGKAFSVVGGTGEQIVIHPGLYLETGSTLTMPNVSIVSANFNAGGICYMNGSFVIAPTVSSTRISGILFNNLTHSGSAGLYLDKVQVKANYTKIGSGYSEIVNSDLQASGSVVFRGGITVISGDKQGLVQVSGSGTAVLIKDSYQVVSPSVVAGGTLVLDNSQVYPLASGSAAITAAAGTVVYLYNTRVTTNTGIPERINVAGFLGYDDIQFNKALSTVGTSLNLRANFQSLDALSLTATGSLFGTASWANNSVSASRAISSSFAVSASWAPTNLSPVFSSNNGISFTSSSFADGKVEISTVNNVDGINSNMTVNPLDMGGIQVGVTKNDGSVDIYSNLEVLPEIVSSIVGDNSNGDASGITIQKNQVIINGQDRIELLVNNPNGAIEVTGSLIAPSITGSLLGTASWAENFLTSSVTNATYAISASYFSGSNIEVSNLVVKGTASIEYLDVIFESASVIYSSGSNQFGDASDDVQTLHGQVNILDNATVSGNLEVIGNVIIPNIQPTQVLYAGPNNELIGDYGFTYDLVNGALIQTEGDIIISSSGETEIRGVDFRVDVSDDIRFFGSDTFYFANRSATDSIQLYTNYEGDLKQFEFGADGNFTVHSGGVTASYFVGPLYGNADTATSASYAQNTDNAVSSSYALNADNAVSASYSLNSDNAINAQTASLAETSNGLVDGTNITVGDLNIGNIQSFTNDVDAAAGGIPVNGVYRNGNFLMIRIS